MLKTVSSFVNAIGALNYKGAWNASTNSPTLASGVGTKGDYYVVSVAGVTNLDGITDWGVGDWAAFNGSVWQRVDGGTTGNFTTVDASGSITGASLIPSGSSAPINGVFLPTANTVGFSTNSAERMRITSVGAVGIGTSSPAGTLHVYGSGATQAVLTSGDDTTSFLRFINTTNGGGYVGYTSDNLIFLTGASERMRIASSGNVGVGTSSPNASAILDAQSTTKGVRFPNMTTAEKNAIASPAAGLVVFDTTLAKLCVYSGAAWQTITSV